MHRTVQTTKAHQLKAAITPLDDGFHFMFTSRLAAARSNEEQVKFQRQFSADELRVIRDMIDQQLHRPSEDRV